MLLNRDMIKIDLENRSYDYQDLIEQILNNIENVEDLIDYDSLIQAINDTLIYYDDM